MAGSAFDSGSGDWDPVGFPSPAIGSAPAFGGPSGSGRSRGSECSLPKSKVGKVNRARLRLPVLEIRKHLATSALKQGFKPDVGSHRYSLILRQDNSLIAFGRASGPPLPPLYTLLRLLVEP